MIMRTQPERDSYERHELPLAGRQLPDIAKTAAGPVTLDPGRRFGTHASRQSSGAGSRGRGSANY